MSNSLKAVRKALRQTQAGIADALGISRGLWSVHEGKPADHDVPPHIARSLIRFARAQGMPLTYEHLYDGAKLPEMVLIPADKVPLELRQAEQKRPRRRVIASAIG